MGILKDIILETIRETHPDAHWVGNEKPSNDIMKRIKDIKEVRSLKPDQRLIRFSRGNIDYYKFLCVHPHNSKYVILMNSCEEPERFYYSTIIDYFATDYTEQDIISYRMEFYNNLIQKLKQKLSELEQ